MALIGKARVVVCIVVAVNCIIQREELLVIVAVNTCVSAGSGYKIKAGIFAQVVICSWMKPLFEEAISMGGACSLGIVAINWQAICAKL